MNYILPIIAAFGFFNITSIFQKKFTSKKDSLLFAIQAFLIVLMIITILIILKVKLNVFSNIILIILSLSFFDFILRKRKMIISYIDSEKKIFLIYLILSAISLVPLAGADSYAYHLAWPKDLISNPEILFEKLNLEYRVVGNGEIVNYLGLLFNSQNFQSYLSITILIFYILKKQNKFFLILLILSTPIVLKYTFDQKPFILPCIIFLIFIDNLIYKITKNEVSNFDLIGFFLSLYFFTGSKYPFLIIGLITSFFFLVVSIQNKFFYRFILIGILFLFLYFIPLPLIKYIEFGDPFSPFLEVFFRNPDQDIISLKNMYQSWDGLKINNKENNLFILIRNLLNFVIPIAPFSFLDTFGFSVLFLIFLRFKNKFKLYLFLVLIVSTSIMVILTNFQSRWYLFVILFAILNYDKISLSTLNLNRLQILLKFTSIVLVSFYSYFLFFVIFNSIQNGFENTKEKTLYLYSDIKKVEEKVGESYILTNARANFFSDKLVQFRYANYSKTHLINNKNLKNINFGYFSSGKEILSKEDIPDSFLESFDPNCFDIISSTNNLVAKRNLFSRDDFEPFVLVKFNKNPVDCIN